MTKYILCFITIFTAMFANEYDLNFFIEKRKGNSINQEIKVLEEKKLEKREDYLQYGKYNKLELSADGFYTRDYLTVGDEGETSSLNIKYGIFQVDLNYDFMKKDLTRETFSVNKSLNDFLYSPESFRRNTYDYEKKISENNLTIKENQDIIAIIEKYGEIKKLEAGKRIKELLSKTIIDEAEKLAVKFEYGEISKLEFDLAILRRDKVLDEILALEDNIKKAKRELAVLADLDTSINFELKEFKDTEVLEFDKVYLREVENARYRSEIAKESLDYEKLEAIPKVDLVGEYNLDTEGYRVGLRFYKGIEFVDINKIDKSLDYDISLLTLKDAEKLRESQVYTLKTNFDTLNTQYKLLKNDVEYKKVESEIHKKRFEEGLIDFIDYTDKVNELENSLIELYKIEQDLNIFKHKIKYL